MARNSVKPANLSQKVSRLIRGESLRVLDLFSGCGGLSLGFQRAGFEIVGGIENDPFAASSHAQNFFKDQAVEIVQYHSQPVDITKISPDDFARNILHQDSPTNQVDVIIGGPPCQAFARIGRAKLNDLKNNPDAHLQDERANLYLSFLDYVDSFQPLAILIENVPDIMNFGNKNVAEEIACTLEEWDYQCAYTILNSCNYGVPQFRMRFFLMAFHKQLNTYPEFPLPTHHVVMPTGYLMGKATALKKVNLKPLISYETHYIDPPIVGIKLPSAITAADAIGDLPIIKDHLIGMVKRGPKKLDKRVDYRTDVNISEYISHEMRQWPGFLSPGYTVAHVTRYLIRDFPIFKDMEPGDEYPRAVEIANLLFEQRLNEYQQRVGYILEPESKEYLNLKKKIVPPYKSDKFPNKWWKINQNQPVRTLTAHIGKDTYTHIHYDSEQARVISVREAARLQSFPDGFFFSGAMNAAFRQIGNSVPPIMAYRLAEKIKSLLTPDISPELISIPIIMENETILR